MKKRILSLFLVLVLCLTLLPTSVFAEGADGSAAAGAQTEGNGQLTNTGEGEQPNSETDTRTEIWCVGKPSLIQRSYDGTTNGSKIPIDLTFTDDGTNKIELTEGTHFTATKTFDSADAGWRTVTVEIELTGETAKKYKLKEGEETFTIDGYINKAYPDLTVTLSKTACTVGEKILPLLSVEGAPEGAAVTYYYLAAELKDWAGSSDAEGGTSMPAIDGNTAISVPGTYYVYAKTGGTKNYEEERSTPVELTVNEAVVEAASVTKADGTDGGTYKSLPAALNAAQDGDTVKLLADHTTNWSDVEGGEYATLAVVKKTLTLDLNGMTVDYLTVGDVVPDEAGGILESYDGNLTVADSAQGGSCGKIKDLEFVKGSLAIQGGRIGDSLTCDGNSGTVTISGGTVCNATVGDGATITVTGGTGHAGTWFNDGTLNITDGTFGNVKFLNNGGTIAISGGTFGTITNINGSGSIPLMPLLADNYAFYQGDKAQNSTEKTLTNVTVRSHTHSFENGKCDCGMAAIVVDNNNSCYNTLHAALDAAANNATITSVTLGQDLTEDVTFNGSAAGALTLNMNGHKLEAEAGVPLTVIGGTLCIEGAGQINQNTASNANPFPAIALTGGKLVITGDLTAQGGYNSSSGRKPAIRAEEGELDLQGNVSLNGGLTITGTAKLTNPLTQGTFYVDASETGYAIAITASDNYNKVLELLAKDHAFYGANDSLADAGGARLRTGTYTIKSHTCSYTHNETNGMAFCNCGRSHAHRDLSEETSVLVNGICPICGYHCPHKNIGNDGVCTDCHAKMVAKVTVGETTTYTADLADALNKAANGTTITLLADTEISAYVNIYAATATNADQMVVTLDLAGHTVTSNYKPIVIGADRNGTASHYGTLKIVGTGNITLDYVTLDTREKGVLDLTGWTGGSISSVTVTRIGNKNEGKLIVGKDAGHIGSLAFAFVNCPSAKITNTKLYGGSYGEITTITTGSGTPSLAGLLPNGCVFKNADGSFADATASRLSNVTVSACDHGGKKGFDISATTCPHCGVAAVAETALSNGLWRRFADLQTAIDADRDGGSEFTLLTDVTGNYTIGGTRITEIDLNGHSIHGTVTVTGGDYEVSFIRTNDTDIVEKVIAHAGAKFATPATPAVIGTLELAEGATWENIVSSPRNPGYKVYTKYPDLTTYKWYAPEDVPDESTVLNNVVIQRLPITSKTLYLKVGGKNLTSSSPKVERGTTVQLCASCNANGADVYIYTGEIVGNNEPTYSPKKAEYKKIGNTWYYVVDLDANKIGTYDIYFTATKDGYKVMSAHKTLTVTKPDLRNAVITFRSSNESTYEPYNATTTAPGFTVTHNGKTLKLGVDYTASGTASSAGVSTQTLTIKATANGDYTGRKTAEWRIVPHKAKVEVGDVIKAYDGTTDLPDGKILLVSAAGSAGYQAGLLLPLSARNGFELTDAKYDSANASETEKNISFTVKLTDTNYTFEDGTTQKDFTLNGADFDDKTFQINKAAIDPSPNRFEQTVFNDLAKTYEIDLKQFLDTILPEGGKYGDIKYGKPSVSMYSDYYPVGGANIENGNLSLSINKAASINQGKEIGTVAVEVETTNYQPFTLIIYVIAQDKVVPVLDGTISASEITYGQALADSKLTVNGTMQDPNTRDAVNGTFAWTDGTIQPTANNSYEAEWTFTPDAPEYATVTGTVTIKVKPAKLTTVSVKASRMYYTGEAQIASIIASGQSVDNTPVTFTYSDKVDGNYTSDGPTFTDAGTYTAYYKAEAANHEPATGTFTVIIDPLPISLLTIEKISKTYDGTASVILSTDRLTFFSKAAGRSGITLPNLALSFSNARFTMEQADGSYVDSPEVGGGKALSFTMTLESGNYVFEREPEGTKTVSTVFATDADRFTITKADAPENVQPGTLNVVNGTEQSYTYDFKQLLPGLDGSKTYGAASCTLKLPFTLANGYTTSGEAELDGSVLTLPIKAPNIKQTGNIGTIAVTVVTDNYEDFNLTLNLNAVNKIKLTPGKITCSDITYGDPLSKSTISGTMYAEGDAAKTPVSGTFAWVDANAVPTNGSEVYFTFAPDDTNHYEDYVGTVSIKVNPKSIEGATVTITNPTYDGYAWPYPAGVEVKLDGKTLKYQVDYTYPTINPPAMNAGGSHTLTIQGIGCYTGEITRTWTIEPRDVHNPGLEVADGVYNGGNPVEPTVTLTDDRGKTIDPKEYTVTFENNINVGAATVTVTDKDGGNYVLGTVSTTFEINKAESTATAPTANNLTYNGTEQALVTAGKANGGTMVYSLSETGSYLNQIPTGKDAGSYTVYYKVVGDDNHNDTTVDSVSVTIQKAKVTVTAENKSSRVGQSLKELSFTCVPALFDGDAFTGALACEADKDKTGSYEITRGSLALNGNYAVTFVKGTYTVEAKLQQSGFKFGANTKTVTYGDVDFPFVATGAAEGSTVTYSSQNENVAVVDDDGTVHILMAGETTITAMASETMDYVKGMAEYTLKVDPKTLHSTDLEQTGGAITKVYDGTTKAEGITVGVKEASLVGTDTLSITGSAVYNSANVDKATEIIFTPDAITEGNYRLAAAETLTISGASITQATPVYTAPTGLTAKYGQTLADVALPSGWSWEDGSTPVGDASTAVKPFKAKFTPADTDNYNVVENIELEVTVNKADGCSLGEPTQTQKYTDASEHTYTPDWSKLPTGQKWSYSSEYSVNNGSKATLTKHDFAADGSLLTYAVSGGKAGDKITITLKASCDNYEDFTITLNVTLTEKDDQKPLTIIGDTSVVYGEKLTLTTTGGSGTGAVTYRIDTAHSTGEATIDPETGVLTPVKVGSVSVIADKAGDKDYNDVTSASFVLMIKPATPTGEPGYTKITAEGKTLKDAALTTDGSTLKPNKGKLDWVDDKGNVLPGDTTVEANMTYKWRFTPDDDNYTALTGEVELYHKSSSGGGGSSGYSYYTIKATAGAGGSISPSGNVSVREGRDQTFTITPDKGYAVSNVKIDGKSIGAAKSYTFENVSRTHTTEVIFMKANGNPQTGVFVDVATGSYYEDAVDWAVENGITKGTDDTHFSPDGICTRAQAVTFLWRAAGSPKPETRTMPFADVPVGSYYYDAVLWAVENGITKGTSDTTFSPNMTCSRAQIVAFLWRSEKSPAAGTANPFVDVKSTAYYADAVLWAVKEDITKGTTNTTFSPDADCTRAQIVTFLWRCKK